MKKTKIISTLMSAVMAVVALSVPVSASNYYDESTVATYSSEAEKDYLINQIKTQNPHALIFTSEKEMEDFFASLDNWTFSFSEKNSYTNAVPFSDEETKDYCITVSTTTVDRVNFYYSYGVRNSRFFTELKGTPYITYTGWTAGLDCYLVNQTITKESMQVLDIKFKVHFDVYLLVEGGIKLMGTDKDLHFKHDIAIGPVMKND